MKVRIANDYWKPLKLRLELEGDELVSQEADLNLNSSRISIPRAGLDSMGIYTTSDIDDLIIYRWFDSVKGWRSQSLFGLVQWGLMNDGLGPRVPAGVVSGFSPRVGNMFDNPMLEDFLRELNHTGGVTIRMNLKSRGLVGIETGLSYGSQWSFFEGVKGRISEWIKFPESSLLESWQSSLLWTRYPYPSEETTARVFVKGLSNDSLKHLWLPNVRVFKDSAYTQSTLLGWSTAWSHSPSEACRRSLRTLRNLSVEGSQYRTDQAGCALSQLKSLDF